MSCETDRLIPIYLHRGATFRRTVEEVDDDTGAKTDWSSGYTAQVRIEDGDGVEVAPVLTIGSGIDVSSGTGLEFVFTAAEVTAMATQFAATTKTVNRGQYSVSVTATGGDTEILLYGPVSYEDTAIS